MKEGSCGSSREEQSLGSCFPIGDAPHASQCMISSVSSEFFAGLIVKGESPVEDGKICRIRVCR